MSWTSGVVRHILPTELTLLVQRDPSANVVAVLNHVKAGYFDEPDHWTGISHVLEHMYFKGTGRRGPGEIARDVQVLGGYVNASTIYDKTVYYAVAPATPGALERVLEIQADALTGVALDPGELAKELEVIIQEAKRKLDTPSAVARESLYELLFQRHRIRRWRIGTEAGLRQLTAADVRAYYETRYVPGRVIVAIVGNLDIDRTLKLAETTLGSWKLPTAAVTRSPEEENGRRPAIRMMEGDVQRGLALIGWRTVSTLDADAAALDLTATLLGHGRGSRLYRAVRAAGLASGAAAVHYTPTEVGELDIVLEGELGTLREAMRRSLDQIAGLCERGPSPVSLERARALAQSGWATQFETVDGRARIFAEAEALGGYELVDELYDRFMAVTAADVQRVAADFLDPNVASAIVYVPTGSSTALEGEWPISSHAGGGPDVGMLKDVAILSHAEQPGGERARHESGVTSLSLPGVDFLVRPKRGSGLVSLLLHVPGLPDRETKECGGVSRLLVRASLRGAGGMTADDLAFAAERLGGGISASTGVDGLGWGITVRAEALARAAELVRCVALEPALASREIAVERTLQASDARRIRDDMFRYPIQAVLREAFRNDPYGLPPVGDPEVVESITDYQVEQWSGLLRSHRAVVVAVGDLDTDQLLAGLSPLARWPGDESSSPPLDSPRFIAGRGYERREKAQTAFAMAFSAEPYGSPQRYAIGVVCTLLSGLAGRLFDALRDQRSLAYTVASLPWLRRRAGAILTYIATSPEREAEARDAMIGELRRLVTEPPTAEEMERARNYAAGAIDIAHQRSGALAGDILDAWLYGAIDVFEDDPKRFRAVTLTDVTSLVQQVFLAESRAEYVIRGSGKSR